MRLGVRTQSCCARMCARECARHAYARMQAPKRVGKRGARRPGDVFSGFRLKATGRQSAQENLKREVGEPNGCACASQLQTFVASVYMAQNLRGRKWVDKERARGPCAVFGQTCHGDGTTLNPGGFTPLPVLAGDFRCSSPWPRTIGGEMTR